MDTLRENLYFLFLIFLFSLLNKCATTSSSAEDPDPGSRRLLLRAGWSRKKVSVSVSKKVSVSVSKRFGLEKSLGIGLEKSLCIGLENIWSKKSLGIGLE